MNRFIVMGGLFIISVYPSLASQQKTTIYFDKPFYVAGEYIFFGFFNPALSLDAIAAEIVLTHEDGMLMDRFFVQINQRHGCGYYKTRYDQRSGIYHLHGYVFSQSTGEKHQMVGAQLQVFGADAKLPDSLPVISPAHEPHPLPQKLVADHPHKQYLPRHSVQVSLDPTHLPADVVQVSAVIRSQNQYPAIHTFQTFPTELPETSFLWGVPLTGHRELSEEPEVTNKLIFGCDARSFAFGIAQVNESDDFFIKMPVYYGQRDIQFIDYLRNEIEVHPVPAEWPKLAPEATSSVGIRKVLDDFEVRKKIYQLFSMVPQSVSRAPISVPTNRVAPDFELDITDLAIRGRMFTVFKEVLTPLKFRKKGDGRYISRVIYESAGLKHFYSRGATFIINGHLTHEADFVANLPIQEVKNVKIYSELDKVRAAFGPIGSGGIIDIEMMDPLYSPPEKIRLPHMKKTGFQYPLNYPVVPENRADVPMINPLLYWNPDVNWTGEEAIKIDFTTSDDVGKYLLQILVIDNQGDQHMYERSFEIVMDR